ncbi:MAG: multiprotein-bridging factor 1 family protein [Rhodopila sp.]
MNAPANITPWPIRASRALLGVEQETLARNVGVYVATLRRVETGNALPETIQRMAEVLERTGIRFVEDGVELRPRATVRLERKRRVTDILPGSILRLILPLTSLTPASLTKADCQDQDNGRGYISTSRHAVS